MGIPAIVGTQNGTNLIKNKSLITLDCSHGSTGYVYKNKIDFTITKIELEKLPKPPTTILLNIADPNSSFELSFLPVGGVGLARIEFIIADAIQIHPMAICYCEDIKDLDLIKKLEEISITYGDPKNFYITVLSEAIGTIAAAFYPRPVIVRFSDFKTNEYRHLLGGEIFETEESNPMLGFRGAARYINPKYRPAFELECEAIKIARNIMGLNNIKIMVPFVRTVDEAVKIIDILNQQGLKSKANNLDILMMVETPENIILLEKFAQFLMAFLLVQMI